MIPGVNMSGNTSIANINRLEGSGDTLSPSVGGFRGQSYLRKFLDPNRPLDWQKIDMNSAKIITVQGYNVI